MRGAQRSHASTCIVLWKQTSVHVVVCVRSTLVMSELSSPPRTYTLRDARCALHSQARTAVADSTSGTGSLSPTSRHLGPHASRKSSDCVWTNVKPRGRSGQHSTCRQAATIVVGGSVPVTLLGECALSRGTRPLTIIKIILNCNSNYNKQLHI
jgi:hypothetical protein